MKSLIIVSCFFILASCSKTSSNTPIIPPVDYSPIIKNVTPDSGAVGTVVTITGNNFGTDLTQDVVKFNGVQAIINSATNTEIKVIVPESATTGKITLAIKTYTSTSDHDFKILQASWLQKADFAGGARVFGTGFAVGDKAYLLTGNTPYQGAIATDLWEYDPLLNVWSKKTDFPGGARQLAIGFSIAGKGYIGTGFIYSNPDPSVERKDLWEYDPALNVWTRKADMPTAPREYATAFTINNKAYVGLGATGGSGGLGTSLKDFWEYDPALDSWTRKADFPGAATLECIGFSVGGKGYVGLGANSSSVFSKEIWQFDPTNNTWSQKNDFVAQGRQGGVSVNINGTVFAGFGFILGKTFADFWKYNPTDDNWILQTQFPGGTRAFPVLLSIGTKGYLGTGTDSTNNGVKDFWQFTP